MYQLDEISNKVKRCKEYLGQSKIPNPEIDNMMTCYLLVYICGEYEKLIKNSIAERASRAGDSDLARYLGSKAFNPVRSLVLSDISGNILENLGQDYVNSFTVKIGGLDEKAVTDYGTIVNNRNLTAHGQDIKITFNDLVESCDDSNRIVNALVEILSPPQSAPI